MDNRAGEMEVFVRAVELGSFSAAARALRLTPSAVSRLIARIEDRLGVRLVLRSTRSLQLTPEGESYFDRASRIVAEIEEAERAVSSGAGEPRGPLRVNANIPFGTHCVIPLIPDFLLRHPGVVLDLTLTDFMVDLVGERTDVAIRTGAMRDSSLKARKLIESRRLVVGAPAYFARHGVPAVPDDLARHNCLNFNFRRRLDEWPFRDGGGVRTIAVTGNMKANNGETMRQLALAGLGIARLSEWHVGPDVAAGRLACVLDAFNPGDREPVHAVYIGHEHLAGRIRAFLDFLATSLSRPGAPAAGPTP
ncbi:LysR family transcriptional regulator [Azospirillum halopraeferens]|uniref:LysR family transcriptional regulator n=1 Tax=Azospirillum halopraeferens TaxID=34010 RepID=UPI00048D9AC2|nr:LysR family transcriptional regulator [Azospirillum halopraeferens]